MHWDVGKATEIETPVKIWPRPYHQAGASNIEMTAYGLLVYNEDHKLIEGIPILKWLASQRNPNGGFASTQVRGHFRGNVYHSSSSSSSSSYSSSKSFISRW